MGVLKRQAYANNSTKVPFRDFITLSLVRIYRYPYITWRNIDCHALHLSSESSNFEPSLSRAEPLEPEIPAGFLSLAPFARLPGAEKIMEPHAAPHQSDERLYHRSVTTVSARMI